MSRQIRTTPLWLSQGKEMGGSYVEKSPYSWYVIYSHCKFKSRSGQHRWPTEWPQLLPKQWCKTELSSCHITESYSTRLTSQEHKLWFSLGRRAEAVAFIRLDLQLQSHTETHKHSGSEEPLSQIWISQMSHTSSCGEMVPQYSCRASQLAALEPSK